MKQSREYKTCGGVAIYKIPVQAFPGWYVNSYLILDDKPCLIDPGTPFSAAELLSGVKNIGFDLKDAERIIITHSHYDHFMLAGHVREISGAVIYAHPADAENIRNPVEKHYEYHALFDSVAAREGMSPEFLREKNEREREREEQFNQILEGLNFEVDRPVADRIGGYEVIHTPGHSPGHICVVIDDYIILGDHILSDTTPHQMPTDFGDGYGLKNYLESLEKIRQKAREKEYRGLAGHEDDIEDVARRAADIQEFHKKRLENILGLCRKEKSAWEITDEYYARINELEGNNVDIKGQETMALTEILAHIEYLSWQGKVESIERDGIKYYRKA